MCCLERTKQGQGVGSMHPRERKTRGYNFIYFIFYLKNLFKYKSLYFFILCFRFYLV